MTSWLIPANTKFYDVLAAFSRAETYWPINAKISEDDCVYIYLAAPYKQVGFVCDVIGTGFALDDIMADIRPFIKGEPNSDGPSKPFMKLAATQALSIEADGVLSLKSLKQNGLNGMLMGARKLENNPALLAYIEGNLS